MKTAKPTSSQKSPAWLACLLILGILALLFWRCFLLDYVHFANDGPLGLQNSAWLSIPQSFLGQWDDINSIGWSGGASLADADSLLRWISGPVGYAKFYIPIALFLLGIGAYFFFRRLGMGGTASILGGLAASLTTNYFSNGCWGAAPPLVAFGMDFLALGALAKKDKMPFWISPALAGLAVGVNVMEAADIGALFSLLVAAYVVYQSAIDTSLPLVMRVAGGIGRTAIVAIFAVFMAVYGIVGFIGTSVTGVSGTQQDAQTKAARWDFATEWSLPKRETLSLIIPGLFGDRVDFLDEKAYWGNMGRDASWERYYEEKLQPGDTVQVTVPGGREGVLQIGSNGDLQLPLVSPLHVAGMTRAEVQTNFTNLFATTSLKGLSISGGIGFVRHTGRGFYFGLLVVIVGLWAVFQAFRGNNSVFTLMERKFIWFWSVTAFVSLPLAYGRFSPFKSLLYLIYIKVPGLSTVRSPEKFLHVMNFAAIILFAYGINGLSRRYFETPFSKETLRVRLKNWWAKAPAFDRRWVIGSVWAIILGLAGWLIYAISRPAVDQYLQLVQFDAKMAHTITGYSLQQVGWFIAFLVADCTLLLLIFSGTFAGHRAKWGSILLGVLLVGDLARADLPYRVFWNYKDKYQVDNLEPIVKFLADKPYEHRVAELDPNVFHDPDQLSRFDGLYRIEWVQQLFPYYNIQTLDIAQLARMPQDLEAFEGALQFPGTPPFARRWQLTNTRYLLGPALYLDAMNQQLDPALRRFRIVKNFTVVPKPGVDYTSPLFYSDFTAAPAPDGEYALIEFTGALPRAKLYSAWETNSQAALNNFTTNGLNPTELGVLGLTGTNDFLTLKKLMSPSFDPARAVLLSGPIAASTNSVATNQSPGEVDYANYEPTDIKLKANAATPAVLLLNDRYDSNWQVWVDGQRAELLRCNYIMRGVFLPPGQHEVEFRFRQPIKMLYVNVAAILSGIGLLGYAMFATRRQSGAELPPGKSNSKPQKV